MNRPLSRTYTHRRKNYVSSYDQARVTALALGLAVAFSCAEFAAPQRAIASSDEQEAGAQQAEQTMEQKYKTFRF